ncbi:pyruvate dehydrogenase E1 component beta subunit [Raineyella antarctica]|uniref:Pyruvate dehydrogenase E1 component beta subunit n=1 Tax=Raineyella antarctica TaxID=1577474 RepID=A0A1G6GFK2_9ACTN|nr:alpha-ketoacid dehydrogenase subunit beta [Raineyella antarctica]SDB80603.1 pyruvate dehydrogenase E1 component beta subunit [Raineyella antarctica]
MSAARSTKETTRRAPVLTEPTTLTFGKALTAGMRAAMAANDRVIIAGEDVATLGGVFRITEGLLDEFGEDRVRDTPLGESGIVGTAIGMAMRGWRPVLEIQFDGFVFPAFSQITTQLAHIHSRTAGRVNMPVVIRIPFQGGIGAIEHHSESVESYFIHTPGLKVVSPSTPNDAYWMIQQAIAADDPVVFLEPKRRYHMKGEVDPSAPPRGLFESAVVRPGTDVTMVAYGSTVPTCLEAAEAAAKEGNSIEVIDLRTLSPLDLGPVEASVRRTGRLVIVHEAPQTLGLGSEVAARIQEQCFWSLEAPVLRVTGFDVPYPPSKVERHHLPDLDRVLDAVDRSLDY